MGWLSSDDDERTPVSTRGITWAFHMPQPHSGPMSPPQSSASADSEKLQSSPHMNAIAAMEMTIQKQALAQRKRLRDPKSQGTLIVTAILSFYTRTGLTAPPGRRRAAFALFTGCGERGQLLLPKANTNKPNATRLEAMLSLAEAPGARLSLRVKTSLSELLPNTVSAKTIEPTISAASPAMKRPADFGNRTLHAKKLIARKVTKKNVMNPIHFITSALSILPCTHRLMIQSPRLHKIGHRPSDPKLCRAK